MGISRNPPREWADIELVRYLNNYLGTNLSPWDLAFVPDIYIAMIVRAANLKAKIKEAGLARN